MTIAKGLPKILLLLLTSDLPELLLLLLIEKFSIDQLCWCPSHFFSSSYLIYQTFACGGPLLFPFSLFHLKSWCHAPHIFPPAATYLIHQTFTCSEPLLPFLPKKLVPLTFPSSSYFWNLPKFRLRRAITFLPLPFYLKAGAGIWLPFQMKLIPCFFVQNTQFGLHGWPKTEMN